MAQVSFEYFPARNETGKSELQKTVDLLSAFQPEFQSVTFGAGGSAKQGSLETILDIKNKTGNSTAGHLTYSGSTLGEIKEFANALWEAGIKQIVALRGDGGFDQVSDAPFADTPEFVAALREHHPFEIAVACYPEVHPKAGSQEADLQVLKAKQDAGASLAITQFFFDNSVFYDFVSKARDAGITIPIVPGILPIYNFERVTKMAKDCGATLPEFVTKAFSDANVCGSSELEVSSELLKAQVHDLAVAGYEAIHIYTLNRVPLASIAAEAFLNAHKIAHENVQQKVA